MSSQRSYFWLMLATLASAALVAPTTGVAQDVWPTDGWPVATPESQGLDSGVLAEMLEYARVKGLPVHSALIVRNGRLVMDATFYPYDGGRPHDIAMTSGLDCGIEPGEKELAATRRSDDWATFALSLPMRAEPGTRYAYCSCNNHLLSALLSAGTGRSALEFARTQLFAPLGIKWDLNTGANINHFTVRMQFLEGRVEIEIEEATGEVKGLRVRGQAADRP